MLAKWEPSGYSEIYSVFCQIKPHRQQVPMKRNTFSEWFQNVNRSFSRKDKKASHHLLGFEPLETRQLLSVTAGYSIVVNDSTINATETAHFGFAFDKADVGATYNYTVTSSGGGQVTGHGTISSANQSVSDIDVSSLSNGTLTVSATLSDSDGAGNAVTATAQLDKTAPTGYSITVDDTTVDANSASTFSFTFAGAEVGATYSYTISSSGGTKTVTGTGTITSATQQITGINVSSLADGTLTVSVKLTDTAGNSGAAVTGTATLDTGKCSISGYVYLDSENNGSRTNADGQQKIALQGVIVSVYREDSKGVWIKVKSVMSDENGYYSFTGLNAGTYNVIESQPIYYIDGKETLGTVDGTAKGTVGPNGFTDIVLSAGNTATGYNFGERGLKSSAISLKHALGSYIATTVPQPDKVPSVTVATSVLTRSIAYKTGTSAIAIAGTGAAITDPDGSVLSSMTVKITNRRDGESELLSVDTSKTNVTATYANGVLTLSGVDTIANYKKLLAAIAYSNVAITPETATIRKIEVSVNDGIMESEIATVFVTVSKGTGSSYSVKANDTAISDAEDSSFAFTIANAEVGATYSYTIKSSAGTATLTGSGTVTATSQQVTGIDLSSLPEGTLTISVILTDSEGNAGSTVTATATLDRTAPTGHAITIDDTTVGTSISKKFGFTFANAEVGGTYTYTITSSGGGTAVTGSGTCSSATQQVSGINVSGLKDGTLTLTVTYADAAGNPGSTLTKTAILDQTAPTGYSITADQTVLYSPTAKALSFSLAGAEIGTTYKYVISSSGGTKTVTGTGSVTSATQQVTGIDVSSLADGTLTISVTLTDTCTNTGTAVKATLKLDQTGPTGYSVTANDTDLNATDATAFGFTFAGATVGTTYKYTITSSGGGTAITGTGTVTSATQQVTGINVSSLLDGTLTVSVTLTDTDGNTGTAATATVKKETGAPTGFTITANDAAVNANEDNAFGFTFANAEIGATYNYTIVSSGGSKTITGTGKVTSTTQSVSGIDISSLADGNLTITVTLTDTSNNKSTDVTATSVLDRSAPTGYSVATATPVANATTSKTFVFTISGAEVGVKYKYVIIKNGDSADDTNVVKVTGNGTITSSTTPITVDVSSLGNGTINVSVILIDDAGNQGQAVTTSFTLDKTAPTGYTVTVDTAQLNASAAANFGFAIANAEIGTTFTYTITSSNAAANETPVTGTGTITSASQHITGVNVSSLSDGTLTVSVILVDAAGNSGTAATATATLAKVAAATDTVLANVDDVLDV
jgi:hypothetical protein